jgi:hypothetical protein
VILFTISFSTNPMCAFCVHYNCKKSVPYIFLRMYLDAKILINANRLCLNSLKILSKLHMQQSNLSHEDVNNRAFLIMDDSAFWRMVSLFLLLIKNKLCNMLLDSPYYTRPYLSVDSISNFSQYKL